jgi:anti-sigma factor RsiW
MPATHPTDVALRDFLLGKLPNEETDSVEAHLSECPECLGRAADERTADTLIGLLTAAQTRLDRDRASAWTPAPDAFSTPALGTVTRSYIGPPPLDSGAEPPKAFAPPPPKGSPEVKR